MGLIREVHVLLALLASIAMSHAAESPQSCEAELTGSGSPVPMILVNDKNGQVSLDPESLPRLARAVRPLGYYGPAHEPLRVTLFLVDFEEGMHLTTPFTKVRLGVHLERGDRAEKVRFEHTYSHLARADSLARAIVDLVNHFDLLLSPEALTREIHLLRAQLLILKSPEFEPYVDRRFVRGALRALLDAPEHAGYFATAKSRSTFRGKRFSSYLLAKQIMIKGFEKIPREEREHALRDLLRDYRPANATAPKSELLASETVQDLALNPRRLLGRPLYVAVSREAFTATMLWFDLMANRGSKIADGGVFLPSRFYGDLDMNARQIFDQPPKAQDFAKVLGLDPNAEWFQRLKSPETPTAEETGRLDTSWRGRIDEDNGRPFGDPTSTAVGLPEAPAPSVGIPVNNTGI